MPLKRFIAKRLYDGNGILIGYTIPSQVIGFTYLQKDEEMFWGTVDSDYLKMELDGNGVWQVVEDTPKRTDANTKTTDRAALKATLEAMQIRDLDTVAKLQGALFQIVKVLKEML